MKSNDNVLKTMQFQLFVARAVWYMTQSLYNTDHLRVSGKRYKLVCAAISVV